MNICKRCGNEISKDEDLTFKCSICKNVKINRELLKPIEDKVCKNFEQAKESLYGHILGDLYLFGSYIEGAEECCDIDFLLIYDQEKLDNLIEGEIEEYIEFLINCYDFEKEKYIISELKHYLDTSKFWDFRKCNEYPECLSCYEEENCPICKSDKNAHYLEIKKTGMTNFCIEKCINQERAYFGIPTCCYYKSECSYIDNKLRNEEIADHILYNLIKSIKKDADISFNRSGISVKVLHINPSSSIEEFQKKNPFDVKFTKIS